MAAPGKGSSRWGSFLTQAVAGMEARLDNILADEAEAAKQPKPSPAAPTPVSPNLSPGRPTLRSPVRPCYPRIADP